MLFRLVQDAIWRRKFWKEQRSLAHSHSVKSTCTLAVWFCGSCSQDVHWLEVMNAYQKFSDGIFKYPYFSEPVDDYRLPFEEDVGLRPSLMDLENLVAVQKKRPTFKPVWRQNPVRIIQVLVLLPYLTFFSFLARYPYLYNDRRNVGRGSGSTYRRRLCIRTFVGRGLVTRCIVSFKFKRFGHCIRYDPVDIGLHFEFDNAGVRRVERAGTDAAAQRGKRISFGLHRSLL